MDKKIEIIFTTLLDNGGKVELGADKDSKLYVNGKQVVIRKIIKLRTFELFLAIIVAAATAIQAIFTGLTFLKC